MKCRLLLVFVLAMSALAQDKPVAEKAPAANAAAIVAQVRRADYRDDRLALKKLHDQLTPVAGPGEVASLISYWRGFALWRRALNGFNDSASRDDLEADLNGAVTDFEDAIAKNPASADAESAEAGCLMSLLFIHQKEPEYLQDHIPKLQALMKQAQAAEPDNPRVLWVLGGGLWYRPVQAAGGQQKAMETYQRGLEIAQRHPAKAGDPLQPSWGEPELLMNLAWSNLNRTEPDLTAAGRYAQAALALVPDWHYVRDILIPQIDSARAKQHP